MRGDPVEHPPESLRLFGLCAAMRWNHLPAAGGIYDQHPKLIDEWQVIFSEQAEHEKREREREANKNKTQHNIKNR